MTCETTCCFGVSNSLSLRTSSAPLRELLPFSRVIVSLSPARCEASRRELTSFKYCELKEVARRLLAATLRIIHQHVYSARVSLTADTRMDVCLMDPRSLHGPALREREARARLLRHAGLESCMPSSHDAHKELNAAAAVSHRSTMVDDGGGGIGAGPSDVATASAAVESISCSTTSASSSSSSLSAPAADSPLSLSSQGVPNA